MKLSLVLPAVILAGVAFSASAQNTAPSGVDAARYAADATVRVQSADACPGDYFASSPSYRLQNGHVVQDGWVCQSLFEMSK
jgi:hypothetical protein